MDATGRALDDETTRWRSRLDAEIGRVKPLTDRGRTFLDNIRAYRADCDHFRDAGDLVRAFECVVWAWSWLEIGAETGDLDWARER